MSEQKKTHGRTATSRRTFLKALGLVGGAGGAVHAATRTSLSPVGRSRAIGVTTGIIIGGAAAAAGVAIAKWRSDPDSPDTSAGDSALRDSLYSAGTSVADGRSTFEEEMKAQYVNSPTGQSPYANTAWSEIRAAAAQEVVNGNSQSDAEQAAQAALNAQTRIAVNNIIQKWNTGITAIMPHLVAQSKNGSVDVIKKHSKRDGSTSSYSVSDKTSEVTPVDAAAPDSASQGESIVFRYSDINLPGSPSDVEEIDSEPGILAPHSSNKFRAIVLGNWNIPSQGESLGSKDWKEAGTRVEHPSFSTQTVLNAQLYSDVLGVIYTEHDSISSDLNTYVSNLVSALNQGAIEASDIYSPRDLTEQFASDDKRRRVAAELAAMGASVPADASWEAKISHPDLQAQELWVDLYPQFTNGAIDIKPDMTISSSDYSLAYIGYISAASGEYQTETLSGDSDLQVLDVAGVEGSVATTDTTADTAESSGEVNLGADPVDQIKNPGDYEDTFVLAIETAESGTFSVPVSDVQQSNGDYIIPDTASPLSGDEKLEQVRAVPVVETTQTSTYVADPTSVDSQQLQDAIQAQKDMADEIDKMSSGGGGGFFSGDLFDWDLFGIPGSIVSACAAVLGAYLWMDDKDGRSRNSHKNRGNKRNR